MVTARGWPDVTERELAKSGGLAASMDKRKQEPCASGVSSGEDVQRRETEGCRLCYRNRSRRLSGRTGGGVLPIRMDR